MVSHNEIQISAEFVHEKGGTTLDRQSRRLHGKGWFLISLHTHTAMCIHHTMVASLFCIQISFAKHKDDAHEKKNEKSQTQICIPWMQRWWYVRCMLYIYSDALTYSMIAHIACCMMLCVYANWTVRK